MHGLHNITCEGTHLGLLLQLLQQQEQQQQQQAGSTSTS
jgi:hypothetical protein